MSPTTRTPRPRYVPRTSTRRPRPASPATLAGRITPRDLWLLEMLHEHRVLTSHHITALWDTSHRVTNRRLRTLYHLHALDSFRPLTPHGSAPEHYTLGRAGADLLAARYATELPTLGWRKDTTTRTAFSPTLEHDLAVNTLLVRLAAHHHPGHELTLWLSPRSAARLWGDWARPDAYAHWRHHDTFLPFFLEYDTGTEPLARVDAKLTGYTALNTSTATTTPLLIHTSSATREINIRRRLTHTADQDHLLIATTHTGLSTGDPTGAWLPLHPPTNLRHTLTDLTRHWPRTTPALTQQALDAATTDTGRRSLPWRPIPPRPPAPAQPTP